MTDRQGWRGKGDKVVKRSPRKVGRTCGRPFTAPRKVTQAPRNEKKRSGTTDKEDSEVQIFTESEVQPIVHFTKAVEDIADSDRERYITARRETMMFEMEQETNKTPEADKTERAPEAEEIEDQDKASDSEDDIPFATLLRQEKGNELSLEQIQDCKEGPVGERAIGVTVAKIFDGVEYRGTIDSFRKARQRYYYHVTYSDGDEEELNQAELRDGYILGLSEVIEVQKTVERAEKRKRTTKKKKKELSDVILPESGDKTVAAEAFHKLDANQKQLVADKVNRQTKKVSAFHSFFS